MKKEMPVSRPADLIVELLIVISQLLAVACPLDVLMISRSCLFGGYFFIYLPSIGYVLSLFEVIAV